MTHQTFRNHRWTQLTVTLTPQPLHNYGPRNPVPAKKWHLSFLVVPKFYILPLAVGTDFACLVICPHPDRWPVVKNFHARLSMNVPKMAINGLQYSAFHPTTTKECLCTTISRSICGLRTELKRDKSEILCIWHQLKARGESLNSEMRCGIVTLCSYISESKPNRIAFTILSLPGLSVWKYSPSLHFAHRHIFVTMYEFRVSFTSVYRCEIACAHCWCDANPMDCLSLSYWKTHIRFIRFRPPWNLSAGSEAQPVLLDGLPEKQDKMLSEDWQLHPEANQNDEDFLTRNPTWKCAKLRNKWILFVAKAAADHASLADPLSPWCWKQPPEGGSRQNWICTYALQHI